MEELDKLVLELTGRDPNEEEVKQAGTMIMRFKLMPITLLSSSMQLMEEIDSDNSGKVEFKEFVRVMAKKAESAKIAEKQKEFEDAFRVNI